MSENTPPPAGPDGRKQPAAVCALCRTPAPTSPPPVSWTGSTENHEWTWCCGDCARANIRAIEGRLDTSWW